MRLSLYSVVRRLVAGVPLRVWIGRNGEYDHNTHCKDEHDLSTTPTGVRVIRHCPVGHPRDEITPTLGVRAPTLGVGTPNLRGTCPYFRVTTC